MACEPNAMCYRVPNGSIAISHTAFQSIRHEFEIRLVRPTYQPCLDNSIIWTTTGHLLLKILSEEDYKRLATIGQAERYCF